MGVVMNRIYETDVTRYPRKISVKKTYLSNSLLIHSLRHLHHLKGFLLPKMTKPKQKWALLIGADKYQDHEHSRLSTDGEKIRIPNLKGAVLDIEGVQAHLIDQMNVRRENILTLVTQPWYKRDKAVPESEPTYANIIKGLSWISEKACQGDLAYLHYCGHGAQATTVFPGLKGSSGIDECIVPTDILAKDGRYLRDVELGLFIQRLVAGGIILTVVLDCCHAAGVTRGSEADSGVRGIPKVYQSTPDDALNPTYLESLGLPREKRSEVYQGNLVKTTWMLEPQGYTLLAACPPYKLAQEPFFDDKKRHGVLTYWLLDTLSRFQYQGRMSTRTLHRRLSAIMEAHPWEQSPVIGGTMDLAFFGTDELPSDPTTAVTNVRANELDLGSGFLHGVLEDSEYAIYPWTAGENAEQGSMLARVKVSRAKSLTSTAEVIERAPGEEGSNIRSGCAAVLLSIPIDEKLLVKVSTASDYQKDCFDSEWDRFPSHDKIWLGRWDQQSLPPAGFHIVITTEDEIQILDANRRPFPNMTNIVPALSMSHKRCMNKTIYLLKHLAQYTKIKDMNNQNSASKMKGALSFTVKKRQQEKNGEWRDKPVLYDSEKNITVYHNDRVTLHMKNTLQVPIHVCIFNLSPLFGIHERYGNASSPETLRPDEERELVPLEMTVSHALDKKISSVVDILKAFVMPKSTSLECFKLKDLDYDGNGEYRGGDSEALSKMLKSLLQPSRDANEAVEVYDWGVQALSIRTNAIDSQLGAAEEYPLHGPVAEILTGPIVDWKKADELHTQYQTTHRLADLDRAIDLGRKALNSPNPYDLANNLATLGSWLDERFKAFDSPGSDEALQVLDQAVSCCRLAVDLSSDAHAHRASILDGLAQRLFTRYQANNDTQDLEDSAATGNRAVELLRDGSSARQTIINGQSERLHCRYRATSDEAFLEQAIELCRVAVNEIRNEDVEQKASRRDKLASRLMYLFDITNKDEHLEEAITISRLAVNATLPGNPSRPGRLCNLSNKLGRKYEATGQVKYLNECINLDQEAINDPVLSNNQPHKRNISSLYSVHLSRRYETTGDKADLDNAIIYGTEAADDNQASHLSNLANRYLDRYELQADDNDLGNAQRLLRSAINSIEDKESSEYGLVSSSMSSLLMTTYFKTHEMEVLKNAITYAETAVRLLPERHRFRAFALHNLSLALHSRFDRTHEMEDLDNAIRCCETEMNISGESVSKAKAYCNLGILYLTKYKSTRNPEYVDSAIEFGGKALGATTSNRDKIACQVNLSNFLEARHELSGDSSDLDNAIDKARLSKTLIEKTPEAREWANIQYVYGSKLWKKHKSSTEIGRARERELLRTIYDLHRSLYHQSSPARDRLRCAFLLANIYIQGRDWSQVYNAAVEIMDIVPELVNTSASQKDQQDELIEFAGVAPSAAASALEAGKPAVNALRLLVAGRDVVANRLFQSRGDSNWHRDIFPDEDNQIHPSLNTFLSAHDNGTIVLINVAFRSDAFLIRADREIEVLRLPLLFRDDVNHYAASLKSGMPPADQMLGILEWLWNVAAEPILDALSVSYTPDCENLPRIWWICTGNLCSLPIHAAGYHSERSGKSVLERAISSYSTSIRSLLYASQSRTTTNPATAVLVSMPETPGMGELTSVHTEVQRVASILSRFNEATSLSCPSRGVVLESLSTCTIFHFAGHGKADTTDPSQSCLLVGDGPITVHDMINKFSVSQHSPFLSYLSACSTGRNGVSGLIDEGLHTLGAFRLAGFRHAIGSLWPVLDSECVKVAEVFYETLVANGMTDEAVALALHRAVVARSPLRESEEMHQNNYNWVSYIHMGS